MYKKVSTMFRKIMFGSVETDLSLQTVWWSPSWVILVRNSGQARAAPAMENKARESDQVASGSRRL